MKNDSIGEIYASPVLAGGRAYYVSRRRGTAAIAATDSLEALTLNPPLDDGVFNASPAVAGNRILLRSDSAVYCVGSTD